jgi:SAM-dependent methyltransferase
MTDDRHSLLAAVDRYYSGRVQEHGPSPRGADWKDEQSQLLRFKQLARLFAGQPQPFSLIDYGCGYAALVSFLVAEGYEFDYVGYDISADMVRQAREVVRSPRCSFTTSRDELEVADFTVASGIFNVKLQHSAGEWEKYIFDTIDDMAGLSRKGFAFNLLTSYSDVEYRRDDLYYADPLLLFDRYKRQHRYVNLVHDYRLYEFTLLVSFEPRLA